MTQAAIKPSLITEDKKVKTGVPPQRSKQDMDCLLVSCSELVPIFTDALKLKCDESFLEESAISSIQKSIARQMSGEGWAYKFVFVDLDDPTLMLGRFIVSLNKILQGSDGVQIDVFATSSTNSERMKKKCDELKVKFIAKPIFENKLRFQLKSYLSK